MAATLPFPAPPRTLTTLAQLTEAGLLSAGAATALAAVTARYAVGVTPAMAALIDPADPADPIGLQFLPQAAELVEAPQERADPIGDHAHAPLPGLVHRYPDRVLIKLLHVCPVYCRFCFRREMVGPDGDGTLDEAGLAAALAYIAARPAIREVVVTGGDPLMASPRRIAALVAGLDAIPHVGLVRWHSRVPVVAPERVTTALVEALAAGRATPIVGVHANHAREFTPAAVAALARLARAGVMLLGQSVLLKGINDTPEALEALLRAMVEARVKPYYLHHADLAPGTGHFRTSIAAGRALVAGLRGRLSGLMQPAYVLDLPGGHGKVPLTADNLRGDEAAGTLEVRDRAGRWHAYPPATAAENGRSAP
jgi:lysine 2,3-aminomutase